MKRLLLIGLLALALPATAQQISTNNSMATTNLVGSLVNTNDTLTLPVSGTQFGTVTIFVATGGSATATAKISVDGGPNFIASALAKKVSAVAANPTVQALSATTLTTGDEWEIPIPANATHLQVLCAAGGTATTLNISPGIVFVPGALITGVLFDTTSAVNTAIDTGTLDLSGWEFATAAYTTPAGGSGTISTVDDAGTSVTMFTVPASATAWYPFAVSSPSATQVTALPATGATGALPIQKRMRFQSAGVAALTSRIRIEVRR